MKGEIYHFISTKKHKGTQKDNFIEKKHTLNEYFSNIQGIKT